MGVSLFFVGGVYLRLVDVLFVLMIFGVFGVFGFVIKNINNIVFIYCLSYNSYDNEIICNWIKYLFYGLIVLMFCDGGLGLFGLVLFLVIILNL